MRLIVESTSEADALALAADVAARVVPPQG